VIYVGKTTISVCKTYKNSGSLRFHKEKTKKHWKHYFIEDNMFKTEWVNAITAQFLKKKKRKKLTYFCIECNNTCLAYVKNSKEEVECPYCS